MKTKVAVLDWYGVLYNNREEGLFPDAADTLRWLNQRGIKVFIVSLQPAQDIRTMLASLTFDGVTPLIRFVTNICGDMPERAKVAYLSGLIDVGANEAHEIIFVDDRDYVLAAAKNAGLKCRLVGTTTGYSTYEELLRASPDKIIHNLKNLQGFINLIEHSERQGPSNGENIKKHSGR